VKAVLDGAPKSTDNFSRSPDDIGTRASDHMAMEEPPTEPSPEALAQRSADRLALALEDVGFDVGVAFPMLQGGVDRGGAPIVDLGRVAESVASRLTKILNRAAAPRCTEHEHWS
jgi:hypothetical protein